jgi:hypothetical protein
MEALVDGVSMITLDVQGIDVSRVKVGYIPYADFQRMTPNPYLGDVLYISLP